MGSGEGDDGECGAAFYAGTVITVCIPNMLFPCIEPCAGPPLVVTQEVLVITPLWTMTMNMTIRR